MQLFYTPGIEPPHHTLSEEESNHCIRVLRMQPGDTLYLTDGCGTLHTATIVQADARRCVVHVTETVRDFEQRPYRLTLAVAPTKNSDRFEWLLEKATEVGVDRFIPIACSHSERRTIRSDRAEKVISSAMKQSLKAYRPALDPMTPVMEVLAMPFDGLKLIAHCEKDLPRQYIGHMLGKGGNVLILIGPEGDFSEEEIIFARAHGFREISLGPSRLRTETAALASVMAVSFANNL